MLYEVDFLVKKDSEGDTTIHTALVFAQSVSECNEIASEMVQESPLVEYGPLNIFISEGEQ